MFPATGSTTIAASPSPCAEHGLGGGLDVVVGDDDRVGRDARRARRASTGSERREPGAGAREQRVDVAVVAAGELEDPVAPRERRGRAGARSSPPRCPRRRAAPSRATGRRRRARRRARPRPRWRRRSVVPRSAASRTASTVSGSACPKSERPPGHHPVEVAAPLDVLEDRALAARGEERLVEPDGAHRAHGRVDAAGDQLERAPVEIGARRSEPTPRGLCVQ